MSNLKTIQPQHHSHPTVSTTLHSPSDQPDHYSPSQKVPTVTNNGSSSGSANGELFASVGQPLVDTCMSGSHASYFSYGTAYDDTNLKSQILCNLITRVSTAEGVKSDSVVHLSIYKIENEKVVDLLGRTLFFLSFLF